MKTLPGAQMLSDIAKKTRPAGPGPNDVHGAAAFASLVKAHPARDVAARASSHAMIASRHANAKPDDQPAVEHASPRSKAHHGDPVRKDAPDIRAKQSNTASRDDETADLAVPDSAMVAIQAIATPIDRKSTNEAKNVELSPSAESRKTEAPAGLFHMAVSAPGVQPDPTTPVEDDRSASVADLQGPHASVDDGHARFSVKGEPAHGSPAAMPLPDTKVVGTNPVAETERHAVVPGDPAMNQKMLAAKPADDIRLEADLQTTVLGAPAASRPASGVAGPPSLAIEITIAAARYTLPATRADDAPQASSSAETGDTGTQPTDPRRDYGARLKSVAAPDQAAIASTGAPERLGSKAAAGVEAETPSTQPSTIEAGNGQDTEPKTAARIDVQATPLASHALPAVASGPLQIQSPANSVASAIVAEPTWRPSGVAIATQSSVDRVPETPKTLSIQLNPHNLGVVVANLSMSGSTLKVHLAAESLEAHDRLKAETHAIEKAMHSLGYEVSEITITQSAVTSALAAKSEQAPQNGSLPERNPQSGYNNPTGGDRPARQNGDRNGHESPSLQGVHATRAADASGGGVYI